MFQKCYLRKGLIVLITKDTGKPLLFSEIQIQRIIMLLNSLLTDKQSVFVLIAQYATAHASHFTF